jgi:hypothetical protein
LGGGGAGAGRHGVMQFESHAVDPNQKRQKLKKSKSKKMQKPKIGKSQNQKN